MDEAERCHRLAILDRGALVADGTPRELIASRWPADLRGRRRRQPRRAQQRCSAVPGVLSVAQLGNALRVLTSDAGDAETVLRERCCGRRHLQAQVERGDANLEDVFVAADRRTSRADDARDARRMKLAQAVRGRASRNCASCAATASPSA